MASLYRVHFAAGAWCDAASIPDSPNSASTGGRRASARICRLGAVRGRTGGSGTAARSTRTSRRRERSIGRIVGPGLVDEFAARITPRRLARALRGLARALGTAVVLLASAPTRKRPAGAAHLRHRGGGPGARGAGGGSLLAGPPSARCARLGRAVMVTGRERRLVASTCGVHGIPQPVRGAREARRVPSLKLATGQPGHEVPMGMFSAIGTARTPLSDPSHRPASSPSARAAALVPSPLVSRCKPLRSRAWRTHRELTSSCPMAGCCFAPNRLARGRVTRVREEGRGVQDESPVLVVPEGGPSGRRARAARRSSARCRVPDAGPTSLPFLLQKPPANQTRRRAEPTSRSRTLHAHPRTTLSPARSNRDPWSPRLATTDATPDRRHPGPDRTSTTAAPCASPRRPLYFEPL
jgi:hypothetical protein